MTNEENTIDEDTDFAFLITRKKDGSVGVRVADSGRSVSPEEIYTACEAITRQLNAQMIAQTTAQAMIEVASHMQQNPGDDGGSAQRTSSGLIVPK